MPFWFETQKLQNISFARATFLKLLTMVTDAKKEPKGRVVVLLDGLSQISSEYGAQDMKWLPRELPENVRLVVTTSNTGTVHDNYVANCEPRQHRLGLLAVEEAKTLVRTFLDTYHKELCEDASNGLLGDQMALLMSKNAARLPLYLLAAASELVTFGVYEKVTPYLKSIPDELPELFDFVLTKLEGDHGEELVRATMTYIALSNDGIMEGELVELLESHPYTKPRVSTFARLYLSIRLYVTAGGSGLLRIVHAPIRAVIAKRYLSDGAVVQALQQRMLQYYTVKADPQRDGTYQAGAARPLVALPYFERVCKGDAALAALLATPAFLKEKARFCGIKTLMKDFRVVPRGEAFALTHAIARTLILASVQLSMEPQTICYHLASRMYALEVAGAAAFVQRCRRACDEYAPLTTGGAVTLTADILAAGGDGDGDEDGGDGGDAGDGKAVSIGKGLVGSVTVSAGVPVTAISPKADSIYAVCMGNKMMTYSVPDLEMEVEQTIYGHYAASPVYSNDGKYIMSCSGPLMETEDAVVKVYEANSGTHLRDLSGHKRAVPKAVVLRSGELATCGWDGDVRFWDVESGKTLRKYSAGSKVMIQSMVVLESRDVLVYGTHTDELVVVKLSTLKEVSRHKGVFCISTMAASAPNAAKLDMANTTDDNHIGVASSYNDLQIVNAADMTSSKVDLTELGHTVYGIVAVSDKHFAVACGDTLAIMEVATATVVRKYNTNCNTIASLSSLPSHAAVAVTGNDMTVKLYGVELTPAAPGEDADAGDGAGDGSEEEDNKNRHLKGFATDLSSPQLFASGDNVVAMDGYKRVEFDMKTGLVLSTEEGPTKHVQGLSSLNALAVAGSGDIAVGDYTGHVCVFDKTLQKMKLNVQLESKQNVTCVLPLANGTLVVGDYSVTFHWLDGSTGKAIKKEVCATAAAVVCVCMCAVWCVCVCVCMCAVWCVCVCAFCVCMQLGLFACLFACLCVGVEGRCPSPDNKLWFCSPTPPSPIARTHNTTHKPMTQKHRADADAEVFGCVRPGTNEFFIASKATGYRFNDKKQVKKKTYPGDYVQIRAPICKPDKQNRFVALQGFKVGIFDWDTLEEVSVASSATQAYQQHASLNREGTRYAVVSGQLTEVNVFDVSTDEIRPLVCILTEVNIMGVAYAGDSMLLSGSHGSKTVCFALEPTEHKGECEPHWLKVKRDDEAAKGTEVKTIASKEKKMQKHEDLAKAVMEKDVATIKSLLTPDVDLNLPSPDFGMTIMHSAVCRKKGDVGEVLKVLVDAGGDLSVKSSLGQTPFALALGSMNIDGVKALLEYDVDVNEKGMQGMTPLLTAIGVRNKELVQLLIDHGADVSAVNQMVRMRDREGGKRRGREKGARKGGRERGRETETEEGGRETDRQTDRQTERKEFQSVRVCIGGAFTLTHTLTHSHTHTLTHSCLVF